MRHKNRKPIAILLAIVIGVSAISIYNSGNSGYYFEGNVRTFTLQSLSLVQEHRNMNCEAFNQISVTYDNGQKVKLADGREGFNPYIDSSIIGLDLTHSGKNIDTMHFETTLSCKGNAMDGTTVVSGTMPMKICGDPVYAGTKCMIGDDRQIGNISDLDTVLISTVALQDDTFQVIHSQDYTQQQIINVLGTGIGKIHFKHETFPILNFNFIHPSVGSFSATYNSQTENSKIIAQYGLIENSQVSQGDSGSGGATDEDSGGTTNIGGTIVNTPTPGDADGDGFDDITDQCPNEAETYNGFEDGDGCPDLLPAGKGLAINYWSPQILDTSRGEATITIGVGIQDLSITEIAPTIKVTALNGFVKEEFNLPDECTRPGLGWTECEVVITLDKDRYPEGSYRIALSSESRQGILVTVPIEFVDQTEDIFNADNGDTGLPNDTTLGKDPSEFETADKLINFITGKQTSSGTSSGVKITRSTQTFDFGTDDVTIILVLVGITASVGLFAKYRKKLR